MTDSSRMARPSLRDELLDVYKTYRRHSFMGEPPKVPRLEYWKFEGEQTARMLFGMTTLAVALIRVRDRLLRAGWPLLPYFCELFTTSVWHISIGRRVQIGSGLVIPHGYVMIDGPVKLGKDCIINPWVTVGLSGSRRWGFDSRGPIIGDRVFIGTGAKVLGPITIGDDVRIGANAVVIDDVPAGATVAGAPARIVQREPAQWP